MKDEEQHTKAISAEQILRETAIALPNLWYTHTKDTGLSKASRWTWLEKTMAAPQAAAAWKEATKTTNFKKNTINLWLTEALIYGIQKTRESNIPLHKLIAEYLKTETSPEIYKIITNNLMRGKDTDEKITIRAIERFQQAITNREGWVRNLGGDAGIAPHLHKLRDIIVERQQPCSRTYRKETCKKENCIFTGDIGKPTVYSIEGENCHTPLCCYAVNGDPCLQTDCKGNHQVHIRSNMTRGKKCIAFLLCLNCTNVPSQYEHNMLICRSFEKTGACSRGKTCHYIHKYIKGGNETHEFTDLQRFAKVDSDVTRRKAKRVAQISSKGNKDKGGSDIPYEHINDPKAVTKYLDYEHEVVNLRKDTKSTGEEDARRRNKKELQEREDERETRRPQEEGHSEKGRKRQRDREVSERSYDRGRSNNDSRGKRNYQRETSYRHKERNDYQSGNERATGYDHQETFNNYRRGYQPTPDRQQGRSQNRETRRERTNKIETRGERTNERENCREKNRSVHRRDQSRQSPRVEQKHQDREKETNKEVPRQGDEEKKKTGEQTQKKGQRAASQEGKIEQKHDGKKLTNPKVYEKDPKTKNLEDTDSKTTPETSESVLAAIDYEEIVEETGPHHNRHSTEGKSNNKITNTTTTTTTTTSKTRTTTTTTTTTTTNINN
jgi:hypothetical protein